MTDPKLSMPQMGLTLRENGDVVLESRHDGELVGEFNISKVMANWIRRIMNRDKKPELRSV
jgi:hypothetical protein